MADPEGFFREDNSPDYLDNIAGGEHALQDGPTEVGHFVGSREIHVDDQSGTGERVLVSMAGSGNSQEGSGPSKDESPGPGGSGNGQLPGQGGRTT